MPIIPLLDERDSTIVSRGGSWMSDSENSQEYQRLKSLLPVVNSPYQNADLVKSKNCFYVLDHSVQRIVYLISWQTSVVFNKPAAHSILVWSDPRVLSIKGYSFNMFFKHLFEENELLYSDQSQNSSRFWLSSVAKAFQEGFLVYEVDMNTIRQFSRQEDFDEALVQKNFKRLIISTKAINLAE